MASKLVTHRTKSNVQVLASLGENKPLIMQKLFECAAVPPEATGAVLDALGIKLETADGEMIAADRANLLELDDDAPFRQQRDEAQLQLHDRLGRLRETVDVAYGVEPVRQLGLEARSPADPTELHSFGGMVLERLTGWTVPASSRLEGYTFNKESWRSQLSTSVDSLGTALSAVAREKREAETTLVAKNRAIEENDRVFSITASILSTMLEAIGEHELARRVRPSRRYPGQTNAATAENEAVTDTATETPFNG